LGLFEVNQAANIIAKSAHPDANIIFGAVIDDQLGDELRLTVIASGFERAEFAGTRTPSSVSMPSTSYGGSLPSVGMPAPQPIGNFMAEDDLDVEYELDREPVITDIREPMPRRSREPAYNQPREPVVTHVFDADNDDDDDDLDIPSFLRRR
ncbi:MAG TPA: cell division protein FtsZ, partial [Actinomycetota bacterium]|nr:cell division protein FtsZ [Actinomycetota bacterium]